MHKPVSLLLVSAFFAILGWTVSQAQEFYYDLNTTYAVTPSNLRLALQFDTTVVTAMSTANNQLFAAHACLDSTVPVEYLQRGFWIYCLQTGYGYAAASSNLLSDPLIHRVVPVYVVVSNSAEFKVTDLIDVQFADALTLDSMNATLRGFGLHFADSSKFRHNLWQCAMDDTLPGGPLAIGNALHVLPGIRWACARQYVRPVPLSVPADSFYQFQTYLKNTGQTGGTAGADINVERAWDIALTNPQFPVAIIDDGLSAHEDLPASRIGQGYDFAGDTIRRYPLPPLPPDDNPAPPPDHNHGTAIAGILAASHNGIGIAGVFGTCTVVPVKIADNSFWWGDTVMEDEAIRFAATKATVISCSWAATRDGESFVVTCVANAIRDVSGTNGLEGLAGDTIRHAPGCVLVFGAGNAGQGPLGTIDFPANMPEVIAVGATDKYNHRWDYSSRGQGLDVMAPSGGHESLERMWTMDQMNTLGINPRPPSNDVANWNYTNHMGGTSASCPQVAGIVALLMARGNDSIDYYRPNLKIHEILARTATDLGDSGWDDSTGWGLVNAYRAMLSIVHGDVDNNARIDTADVRFMERYCFHNGPTPVLDKCVADTDCDGDADICDYLLTLAASYTGKTIAPCYRY